MESNLHFELLKTNGKIVYSDLPVIDADFTHMWQMFANLISNSLKYKRDGVDSVVNITAENRTKEGVVRLVISDNGLGFSDEDAKIIFDKFSRLNDGDAVEDSYGIGLSTVFQIVESHRGVISAVGRVDQGADFIVELPLAQEKKSAKSVLVESRRVS
ncbi:MAG: HAMP domain-containing histidine kinase [Pseudomonadales bacterium]|nr:HAMP domain-containing histidine kinase [Pseudomonadales bacterium]